MGGGGTNQENQLEDDPTAGLDREGSLGETGRGTTGHGEPHHGASEQVWLQNLPKGGKSSRPGKREENQGIEVSGRQICPKPFISTRSIPFLLFLSDNDPCDLGGSLKHISYQAFRSSILQCDTSVLTESLLQTLIQVDRMELWLNNIAIRKY